jgi:hypothetical protein
MRTSTDVYALVSTPLQGNLEKDGTLSICVEI